jgi:hypothetical protein
MNAMFFIVAHTWEPEDQANVNSSLVNLCRKGHYGLLGDPWPKLFSIWITPDALSGYSLWEAQNPESLEKALSSIMYVKSSMTHVRQLYPPHVNAYNMLDMTRNNAWDV